jgi:hypothetical protein
MNVLPLRVSPAICDGTPTERMLKAQQELAVPSGSAQPGRTRAGRTRTAGELYFRATNYLCQAERMLSRCDPNRTPPTDGCWNCDDRTAASLPDDASPGERSDSQRPDGPDRAMTERAGRWTIWPGNGPSTTRPATTRPATTGPRPPGPRPVALCTATQPTVGPRPMSRPTGSELLTTGPQVTTRRSPSHRTKGCWK